MFHFPRFFYEEGSGGGGGNADATVVIPENIQKELDELRAFKETVTKKEPEKTPEQLARENELDEANFRKYSVDNDLLKNEDFTTYDSLKKTPDQELVFKTFSKEYKEDNPDATDDDVNSAFKVEYKLTSENAKEKARGENRIKKEAADMRNPLDNSFKTAQNRYTEEKSIAAKAPGYKKFFDDLIKEVTPDKLPMSKVKDGEEEISIEVELTKDDREEIAKAFFNGKTFRQYLDNETKLPEVKDALTKKINGFLRNKYFDVVASKSFEAGHGRGVKAGSNVGATQRFGVIQGGKGQENNDQKKSGKEEVDANDMELRKKIRFGS